MANKKFVAAPTRFLEMTALGRPCSSTPGTLARSEVSEIRKTQNISDDRERADIFGNFSGDDQRAPLHYSRDLRFLAGYPTIRYDFP
jgi:hypothetical protein